MDFSWLSLISLSEEHALNRILSMHGLMWPLRLAASLTLSMLRSKKGLR